jgi:hypothetical protein
LRCVVSIVAGGDERKFICVVKTARATLWFVGVFRCCE